MPACLNNSNTMTPGTTKKRNTRDASISPPPLRAKKPSGTTKSDVASFFTPQSQKPVETTAKTIWQQRVPHGGTTSTLLVGYYNNARLGSLVSRHKLAAFDFDDTLVKSKSGKKFSADPKDWTWWNPSVPEKLRKLHHEEGYQVVILSNQGGISFKAEAKPPKQTRLTIFQAKASDVLSHLDIPITLLAATENDIFRKPRTGMWNEIVGESDAKVGEAVDLETSFFVGDAAGRPDDHSAVDRHLAQNIGIRFFTPEEYFLEAVAKPYSLVFDPAKIIGEADLTGNRLPPTRFSKMNKQELVIFCGSPAAGKSTFYFRHLKPLGYERVNQDLLKTRDKCLKVAQEMLSDGKSVAVDNTNPDEAVRRLYVELAAKNKVPIRCVHFTSTLPLCEHNDAVRAFNPSMNSEKRSILPKMAFNGFKSRFQKPTLAEGFQDVTEIPFHFDGNEVEREIWGKHWT